MSEHTRDEYETTFTQTADDRVNGVWHVFTNDPYWKRRLDERGTLTRENGYGWWYCIQHRQITLRTPDKKAVTQAQMAALKGLTP